MCIMDVHLFCGHFGFCLDQDPGPDGRTRDQNHRTEGAAASNRTTEDGISIFHIDIPIRIIGETCHVSAMVFRDWPTL